MIKRIFLNERFILWLILLNAAIIFVSGFKIDHQLKFALSLVDNIITLLFVVELWVKIREFGKEYFKSYWNKFDFTLIVLSVPAFLVFIIDFENTSFSYLLVLRAMRVFKTFRFLKFIPGIDQLYKDIHRALKASLIVLLGFVVYIFIVGIFSFFLFHEFSPEYFSNPLKSLYATFKIFTVEGWFEIPESITKNMSPTASFFTYIYFIFVLLSGGIFGLSLVNSIFVDAMVADNNDELERKIDILDKKIDKLLKDKK